MRLSFLLILFVSFIFASCSGTKSVIIPKSDDDPAPDGNITNWDRSGSLLEQTNEVNYHAFFTDNYLYIFVDVRSPMMQRAVTEMGMIFYLAHKKDDRKNTGIAYPAGTMNLLRDNPGAYRDLTTDPEWLQSASNQRLLSDLESELFERVMVIERHNGRSALHGFVSYQQLEAEGIEFGINPERRFYGIELRIPLDGSSLFGVKKDNLWLGFSIEPPDIRQKNPYYNEGHGMTRDRQQRQRQRQHQSAPGTYEKWYLLEIK